MRVEALISEPLFDPPQPPAKQSCIACGSVRAVEFLQAPDRFHGQTERYSLLRCSSCAFVWLDDPPLAEQLARHYGPLYDSFIRKATEVAPESHWSSARKGLLEHKQGGALLDLGCGAGSFLNSIQGPEWQLFGVEFSSESAQRAEAITGAKVFVGELSDAHFPEATFDAITCFHVLEHTYCPQQIMNNVYRWLKPGGIFCVHVPNITAAEATLFGSYWYPLELPRHLFHFSPVSLRRMARLAGLRELQLRTSKTSFVEYSLRYLCDDLLRHLGFKRTPLCRARAPHLAWRVIRKASRLMLLPLINMILRAAGEGQIIEAVFCKGPANSADHLGLVRESD